MIQTNRLKYFIFFQAGLNFALSRKIIKIYNDIARKLENVNVNVNSTMIQFSRKNPILAQKFYFVQKTTKRQSLKFSKVKF